MTTEIALCELCGEPMPAGEEMFKFHGYSGPCPKPPLPRPNAKAREFHNALRIMLNISVTDLHEAGVIDGNWGDFGASGHRNQPHDFVESPFREALRMPDANFDRLFALIESRQPKKETA